MPWQFLPAQDLAAHAAEWDALQRASSDTPFLETVFLLPLLQVFGDGDERLALLREGGTLRAATLLRPLGKGRWETFQPSQLPLGPWVSDAALPLSDTLHGLLKAVPGLGLSVGLTQLDPRLHPRPSDDGTLRTLDYVSTSWVDIDGAFDVYWEARGKNLRQNTRKLRNKLQADAVATTLECLTSPDDVSGALADYGRLESTGWKAGTGTAIHPDNEQGRFYGEMLRAFCAEGRGRVYRYRFGTQVVAMDLCIESGPLVVILKTAYDEAHSKLSPSTLMRQDEFRAWWEEGRYRRIEFYGKTLEWHTRWTEQHRVLYHATRYRHTWLANMAAKRQARSRAVAQTGIAQSADAAAA
jgi:CelD/BcsL family acetyltransferase involved in cellulose biosynthesis